MYFISWLSQIYNKTYGSRDFFQATGCAKLLDLYRLLKKNNITSCDSLKPNP